MSVPRVVLVTDPRVSLARTLEVVRAAAAAIGPDGLAVQLRDKTKSPIEVARAAKELRAVTRDVSAKLVVNAASAGGRGVALAAEVAADGVHLGSSEVASGAIEAARRVLGPRAFVSAAAHDAAEVTRASEGGADAVLVSPIFASPGKGVPRGLAAITEARRLAPSLAIFALGGVDATRAASCAEAGADGVAVIRALLDAGDARDARDAPDLASAAAIARALADPFSGRAPAPRRP